MLKFVFWSLLCLNAVLLAYGQGYLGNFKDSEREPARLTNQLNADKLTVVPAGVATAPDAAASAPPAPEAAAPAPLACLEIGRFSASEARRFEALLAPLGLGERLTRESVASQEITNHIVYIPPLGSKENAERKAAELKNMGVTSYFVMSDNTPLKWAISLGVFKSETAAKTLLAALNRQGVTSARIMGRGPQASKTVYTLRDIDQATKARLTAIAARFPGQDARSCN